MRPLFDHLLHHDMDSVFPGDAKWREGKRREAGSHAARMDLFFRGVRRCSFQGLPIDKERQGGGGWDRRGTEGKNKLQKKELSIEFQHHRR
jgi:hypothetical protein